DGDKIGLTVSDPKDFTAIYSIPMDSGSLNVGSDEIALSQSSATSLGASVGDTVTLRFPTGPIDVQVRGVYDDSNVINDGLVRFTAAEEAGVPRLVYCVAVDDVDGDSVARVGNQFDSLVRDIPTVTVLSQAD